MIVAFFSAIILAAAYAVTFVSYSIFYLGNAFQGQGVFYGPLLGEVTWVTGFAPLFFFIVAPLAFGALVLVFVSFSYVRWRGRNNLMKFDPIVDPKIAVVLTAYNDEEAIGPAVRDFIAQPNVKKVIVVDNNCVDRTVERAEEAGAVVVEEKRQGYGFACMRGLREGLAAEGVNVVALCEGDRTFRGYDLGKMVPYLDNVDMVLGSRTTQELLAQKSQLNWFYVWGNLFLAKLIQLKFWDVKHWGRVRLTDVGCTFRVLRRSALEEIIGDLNVGSDHFSPHMMMVAMDRGVKALEVPITFQERVGKSKGAGANMRRGVGIGLAMLWNILSY